MRRNTPYYIIAFSLFLALCAPTLWRDGMFVDGVWYATISKNLANNLGSFWFLYFTNFEFPVFHEHPPLAIGLQSIFFSIFGESIYIERIYSFSSFIITALVIHLIWKEISKKEYSNLSWIPLLLWITIPLNFWSCSNNMLENTMNIFVALSILFLIKNIKNNNMLHLMLGGGSLSLAFLSKGFVGLFPLSFFIWVFFFIKNIKLKDVIKRSLMLMLFTSLPFIIINILYPPAIESLNQYIQQQVVRSIEEVQTVSSRLFIIKRLISELLPALIISGILFSIARRKKIFATNDEKKWGLFFLFIGLSGVVPIMISLKQSGFYMLTTFPLFSLSLSVFIAPIIYSIIPKENKKVINISIMVLLLSLTISVIQFGKISRHKDIIEDIRLMTNIIPENASINIPPNMKDELAVIGYFARYGNISLDTNNTHHPFFLTYEGNTFLLGDNYTKIDLAKIYPKKEGYKSGLLLYKFNK